MSSVFQKELKRLSNLKQNKEKVLEELEGEAKRNLVVRRFKSDPLFSYDGSDQNTKNKVRADQKNAEERFRSYLENYEIESESDIDTLSSLVYNEIFEKRIQEEINKLLNEGKYPNDRLTKQLTDIQNQKLSLKVKLGIDRVDEKTDDLTALQLLQKRAEQHILEHRNEHTIWLPWECEKCGHEHIESYLLYYKVDDFRKLKHPWFAGRFLFNLPLVKLVKNKKITKEEAAEVLYGAGMGGDYDPEDKQYCADYIEYLLENFENIIDLLNKKQET